MTTSQFLFWIAVALVVITSSARITRLLTFDLFPPVSWLRTKYVRLTENHGDWNLLAVCPYCMSFWVAGVIVLWGWSTDWQAAWWIVNGIFGASYLAAILVVHDGEDD